MYTKCHYLQDGGGLSLVSEKYSLPNIKKVFFNNGHTTGWWEDGEKTTVGCKEGEHFDEYAGLTAAICKRIYGSSAVVKQILKMCKEVQPPKKPHNKKRLHTMDAQEKMSKSTLHRRTDLHAHHYDGC